ncbi:MULTISPECIES: hypothetical protein [unclassified Cryobacterium]|nr:MULTISPECIES: hypothetical protein [unclassified Cryobacterium]
MVNGRLNLSFDAFRKIGSLSYDHHADLLGQARPHGETISQELDSE